MKLATGSLAKVKFPGSVVYICNSVIGLFRFDSPENRLSQSVL